VHTGKLIWADDYRCAVAECERIEDGVAQEIAAQVAAHLASAKPSRIPARRRADNA